MQCRCGGGMCKFWYCRLGGSGIFSRPHHFPFLHSPLILSGPLMWLQEVRRKVRAVSQFLPASPSAKPTFGGVDSRISSAAGGRSGGGARRTGNYGGHYGLGSDADISHWRGVPKRPSLDDGLDVTPALAAEGGGRDGAATGGSGASVYSWGAMWTRGVRQHEREAAAAAAGSRTDAVTPGGPLLPSPDLRGGAGTHHQRGGFAGGGRFGFARVGRTPGSLW